MMADLVVSGGSLCVFFAFGWLFFCEMLYKNYEVK